MMRVPKKWQLPTSTGQSLEKTLRLLGINLSGYVGRLYSFTLMILFFMLSQMSWHDVCTEYCEEHLIRKFMVTLEYILYILLVLTTMGTSVFRPKQFAFPHQEMFIIDSMFESYGARFSKKDIFLAHLQDAAIMIVALFIMIKYAYDIITNNSYQLIYYYLQSWYCIVCLLFMDGLFTHYINDIFLRFRELNKIAIQHSRENLWISYVDFIANLNMCNKCNYTVITKLRLIQHIHHGLYILATKINTNFNLQLLIISAICLNAIILLLFVMFVNDLETKFKQMGIILHDVYLEHKSLQAEVIQFSLQLIHEDLIFTAFGLYEINMSLICSIAGAVVTYLVMVIQLDTSEKFAHYNITTT
ncbi:uncharacterized protein LOC115245881 isoform X3 [Formica exsecta]|uniref:uncharacterized protein LOC115245881 isoform X3 n=1 Tax=Formica exsecta TaxID=72781 RepID=UPI001142C16C|nr:uncharacterized protein LOC115245881 isoform X3 [Formica exsecta]